MKPPELTALLEECYRDKLALKLRHEEGAQLVPGYEFNNTYQYVINRETLHLSWLADAITSLGGTVPSSAPNIPVPATRKGKAAVQAVLLDDVAQVQRFGERWRGRLEVVTHARHRKMLQLMLGETLEQQRFFEQALAGRLDLMGPRPLAATGGVIAGRWRGD